MLGSCCSIDCSRFVTISMKLIYLAGLFSSIPTCSWLQLGLLLSGLPNFPAGCWQGQSPWLSYLSALRFVQVVVPPVLPAHRLNLPRALTRRPRCPVGLRGRPGQRPRPRPLWSAAGRWPDRGCCCSPRPPHSPGPACGCSGRSPAAPQRRRGTRARGTKRLNTYNTSVCRRRKNSDLTCWKWKRGIKNTNCFKLFVVNFYSPHTIVVFP